MLFLRVSSDGPDASDGAGKTPPDESTSLLKGISETATSPGTSASDPKVQYGSQSPSKTIDEERAHVSPTPDADSDPKPSKSFIGVISVLLLGMHLFFLNRLD